MYNHNPTINALRKQSIEKAKRLKEIIEDNNSDYYPPPDKKTYITVNGIKYNYAEVKTRLEKITTKIKSFYNDLSQEEKLILKLPIIQWRLNYRYGAVMILHWLEGTKESIKFDYDFFMSEERVKKIDEINLKEYFKNIEYISIENLAYTPSNPDALNLFLFNDSIPAVKKSLQEFTKFISNLNNNTTFGDFDSLSTHIDQTVKIKNNLFQSFTIGSAIGDFDNVGTTLGRYSFRVYFKGFLSKNQTLNKWMLDIEEVGGRFIDEFSFNDKTEWTDPKSWKSQSLGCWVDSIEDVGKPSKLRYYGIDDKICIENSDFRSLRDKCKKKGLNLGGDFIIYSDLKKIKDDFLQKTILIH